MKSSKLIKILQTYKNRKLSLTSSIWDLTYAIEDLTEEQKHQFSQCRGKIYEANEMIEKLFAQEIGKKIVNET